MQVPLAQKWLVQKARLAARPVMVAGQLMEGMAAAPRPSRPEITDVVNAVYDGADAVVLMQVGHKACLLGLLLTGFSRWWLGQMCEQC